jgi:UDP-glucose 4-epimerase
MLVTGGMGFIGQHTVRALADLGHSCLVTSHRTISHRAFGDSELGERVVVEPVDVAERAAVMALGERHRISGIVHLADPALTHLADRDLTPATLIEDQRRGVGALLNVLEAASLWGARRLTVASTIGVYGGLEDTRRLREDAPLPLSAGSNPVGAWKRCAESIASLAAQRLGVELVIARLPGVWGPLGRNSSRFFAAPALIHAAAAARSGPEGAEAIYADDAIDMLYVKDCARAIALLQTAARPRHVTYNVGSGASTSNRELVSAIASVAPEAEPGLRAGRNPAGPSHDIYLDTARLREDTAFEPRYSTEAAAAEYIAWLRAGNEQ